MQAAPDAVWRVVGDPEHQARWWPKVTRVESVQPTAFTRVYTTKKGRPIRADFRIAEVDAPRRRRWVQVQQQLRGLSRFGGGFMLKRATRKQLDEALDALERVL